MNGYELCRKAILRMGRQNESDILIHSENTARDLEFLNQIAEDLKIDTLNELSDEINCDAKEADALCSGVTMLLSLSESEMAINQLYTAIYNAKRATVLGKTSKIEDTLPVTESGEQ